MDPRELRLELEKLRDDPDVSERLFRWLEMLLDQMDHDAITKKTPAPWSNKQVLDELEKGKKT